MFYYRVESSHWPMNFEFQSEIKMPVGQCFRITEHDGFRSYPTRFKVIELLDTPSLNGTLVTIKKADLEVAPF